MIVFILELTMELINDAKLPRGSVGFFYALFKFVSFGWLYFNVF